jgi:nucleoside-diphosphate-sugar epimerase
MRTNVKDVEDLRSAMHPAPSDGPVPTALAITGPAGALGVHVVRRALETTTLPVRVLIHRTELPDALNDARVTVTRGNLLDPAALDRWLCPGAAVVHLAWSSGMTAEQQSMAASLLADAAASHRASRFVLCSTAVVAGRAHARLITEDTPCEPSTPYETGKYTLEESLQRLAAGRFRLAVARPTAIFGPGLQNLLTLVQSLSSGRAVMNYARASLFGRRNLHLVPVATVADALLFLAQGRDQGAGASERYIISADDEPGGDFQSVERRLRDGLGLRRPWPALPLPSSALRLVLRAAGRTDTEPERIYDGRRLLAAGFVRPVTLAAALDQYAAWHRGRQGTAAA